jgi:hypothetical protein
LKFRQTPTMHLRLQVSSSCRNLEYLLQCMFA